MKLMFVDHCGILLLVIEVSELMICMSTSSLLLNGTVSSLAPSLSSIRALEMR
jgi:hypothetical protein